MAHIGNPHSTEVAMSSTNGSPIDMVRLAALLGRLETVAGGVCTVPGCVHDHAAGPGGVHGVTETALAA